MKMLQLILLAATSLMLASCLEVKSTVTVSKDGSATIEESVLVGAQFAALMQAGGGGPGDQLKGLVMDKAKAEERAKKLGEGVTVKSHEEVKTPDGKSGVKVVFAVADVSKLKYVPAEPEQDGKPSKNLPVTFAVSGSTLTITNPNATKKGGEGAEKPKKSPEEVAQMKMQMAMAKPMLAGMRITVEVKGANGIASSNASHLNDGTVTFMDVQFDKLSDNMDAFAEVMESGEGGSLADVAKKFDKVEGLKLEGKEVVTIELK